MNFHFQPLALALVAGSALLLTPVLVRAAMEETLQKQFDVKPGGRLVIEADRGSIDLTTGDTDKVEIAVHRKVGRGNQAKGTELLERHEVTFESVDSTVTVRARSKGGLSGWRNSWSNFQVNYRVTLPKGFNVDLKTAGGNISVPDLTGEVRAQTSGGSVRLGHIDGPVWGKTSGGNIHVESATSAIEVRTSGGGIRVGEARSSLIASTSGGNIEIQQVRGQADLGTSGGSIRIDRAMGAVQAGTSGGNVTVNFSGSPEADSVLRTSGGSVTFSLPDKASAEVDLRTSGGRVSSDLPVTVQGEQRRSSLAGRIGDGGRLIKASTSGGNVSLRRGTTSE